MSTTTTMKAIHYEKPFAVSVREVPLPKIEHPDDAIVRVTTAGKTAELRESLQQVHRTFSYLWLGLAHVSRENGRRSGAHIRYHLDPDLRYPRDH